MSPRPLRPALVLLVILLVAPPALAQATAPSTRGPATAPRGADPEAGPGPGEPVLLGGEVVIRIYFGIGPVTAADRARRISQRLAEVVADPSITDLTVQVDDADGSSELRVGTHAIMLVTDMDAAAVRLTRSRAAWGSAELMTAALRAERHRRDPAVIARGAVRAGVATLGLALALWLLWRTWRLVAARVRAWGDRRLAALNVQGIELVPRDRLSQIIKSALRLAFIVLILVLVESYVTFSLSQLPWTRPTALALRGYIVGPLSVVGEALVGYLPSLVFLAIIALVTTYVLRLTSYFFRLVEHGRLRFENFPPEWADPTNKVLRVLVMAFALVMAFPYLPGSNSSAFAGVSVFIGVLFSLASSSSISNLIAGLVLTYTRAFRLGDHVKIGEAVGDIVEHGLLATKVMTIRHEEITIPNSIILNTPVTNYTRVAASRGLILHTSITIGYDAPWRTIHELLTRAALATRDVLPEPAPFVWQTSLNDFYVTYEINVSTANAAEMQRIYADLHANIQDAFYAAGVEIMSPHILALRDGNTVAIPEAHRPADYEAPRFRVEAQTPGQPAPEPGKTAQLTTLGRDAG